MKYGLLVDFGAPYCNYGDYVQSIAIEYIYEQMGISKEDIVYLSTKQLATYDGEQLLLPYSYVLHFLVSPKSGNAELSNKITPVFLGASVEFAMLLNSYPLENFSLPKKKWISLFRRFAPIGCRDNFTKKFLLNLGISSYLQGCITNILPGRPDGNYKKVFLVDCPKEIIPYIPPNLRANAEVMTNAENIGELSIEENYSKIKRRYQYYRDNASLMITSRYHVATPCNAMGIPTIFVIRPFDKHSQDIRLDTLHPNIQICSESNYSEINWSPIWRNFDNLKSDIMLMAMVRIREAYERYTRSQNILSFFEPRINQYEKISDTEATYKTRLRDYIQNNYARPKKGEFYIWGAIQLLCDGDNVVLVDLINEINPRLEFAGWIDTFKTGRLANRPIIKPDELSLSENQFILVAAETAVPDALKRFKAMELSERQFFVLANTMLSENDLRIVKGNLEAEQ